MSLIDFHTHLFPNKLLDALWKWFETHAWPIEYKHYSDDLIKILKQNGVSQCVHLHYPHKPGSLTDYLNNWASELSKKYPDFVIPFGSVHPDDENKLAVLQKCFEDFKYKGIKIHCHVQKVSPDDARMSPVYEAINHYKKILLIHCGTGPHFKEKPTDGYGYDVSSVSGAKKFSNIIKKYPDITFVVPHLGFEEIDEFVGLLDDHPNLYLDTAMAVGGYFPFDFNEKWLHDHADRILFGSDYPNIPYQWDREKNALLKMKLGKEVEDKIFFKNAAKLLGIKPS